MRKSKYWYKLDNAAKIFPAVSKDDRSNVFRLSLYVDEIIDPDLLEQAVNQILPRFESFSVTLKSGLFWNYFANNHRPFFVEPERPELSKYFKPVQNQGYLFKVYYLDHKVTLETFHALSDGAGAMQFLKSIVFTYFKLRGFNLDAEGKILSERPYSKKEDEDNFNSNYDKSNKINLKEEKAYHITGEKFNRHWVFLLKISLQSKDVIKLIKEKYQVTVTQFFTALFAYSIYNESVDFYGKKKPIKIFIPVNLRPYFDSVTLRNFSLYIRTTYAADQKWTFSEVLEVTKAQFAEQLVKEQLHGRISSLVGFEKNVFIRILPLVLKTIAFKIGYRILGDSVSTVSFSNLGIVDLPKDLKPHVIDADFVNAGYGITLTAISIHDRMNVMLASPLKDLSIINHFVSFLVAEGLDVTIDTNYREGYDEIL